MNKKSTQRNPLTILAILCVAFLTGCATLDGPENPDDPLERYNRAMHEFNDTLDIYLVKPVAKGYQAITPDIVDSGITNIFSNLDDILVMFNNLLQFKFADAIHDSARIVFNSTFGLLGFFDVATDFGLSKHNEDLGQTLGYWGLESGPYLVLPLLGPSNIRDGISLAVELTELNITTDDMSTAHSISTTALKVIDQRADLLKASSIIDEAAPDAYAFIRDAWTQRRLNLVHDGNPPETFNENDLFEDDLFTDDIKR